MISVIIGSMIGIIFGKISQICCPMIDWISLWIFIQNSIIELAMIDYDWWWIIIRIMINSNKVNKWFIMLYIEVKLLTSHKGNFGNTHALGLLNFSSPIWRENILSSMHNKSNIVCDRESIKKECFWHRKFGNNEGTGFLGFPVS